MGFKLTPNLAREAIISAQLDKATLSIAVDGLTRSKILAPKDKLSLTNNGRIDKKGNASYTVEFGDKSVPYARIHELGGFTGRGYKTYITAKHYLENGMNSVTRGDIGKYFK